nr:TetR/AcrR family transcriptional regulator [Tsukamurella sp. PLM1]
MGTLRSSGTRLRPAERRRQLIGVATDLFLERGYGNVSVSDIARAAGISGPSVYRHFPDKEAVLAAAMRSAVDEMGATTSRVLARPGATFDDLASAVFAMAVSDPGPLALWRWNRRHLRPEQAGEMIAASEAVLGSWTEVLRRDHPELTDDDARVLTWAVLAVGGSVPPSRGRIGIRRYRTDLEAITARVLRAAPSKAPALPAPRPRAPRSSAATRSSTPPPRSSSLAVTARSAWTTSVRPWGSPARVCTATSRRRGPSSWGSSAGRAPRSRSAWSLRRPSPTVRPSPNCAHWCGRTPRIW